jgi:hypothetical protein
MIHEIYDLLGTTVTITGFVVVMMLFIEYLNVATRGRWSKKLLRSGFSQIVTASLLGLIPGCLGGFAAVSLFTHRMISFGALIAAMIASSGDEAFVMFALFPGKALMIQGILLVIALAAGILTDRFLKDYRPLITEPHPFELHHQDDSSRRNPWENIKFHLRKNFSNLSFNRFLLMAGLLLFIFSLLSGWGGHEEEVSTSLGFFREDSFNLLFAILSAGALLIIAIAEEHFLEDHLWNHIIRKHFLRIFLWTLAALIFIRVIGVFVDAESWIGQNQLSVLLIAVLLGIIPESGPHLIFVTLFAEGSLPLSILLASSIVQDGHSGLPLLAETKQGFLLVKAINLTIGLAIGLSGYFWGY